MRRRIFPKLGRFSPLCFFLAALGQGCAPYDFHSARFYEATRRYPQALKAYDKFLQNAPDHPRAGEAGVRAGDIYATVFRRCAEARRRYEAAARRGESSGPWFSRARMGMMNCPDYFPLQKGSRWVYGDSASRGENMRLTWKVLSSNAGNSGPMRLQSELFAGKQRISTGELSYEKRDWEIIERRDSHAATILRYPFRKGLRWHSRRGGDRFLFEIVADSAEARTAAGVFRDCLKVRETNLRFGNSWKYDYYAPFVGKVLTTVAGPGFENRNTELIRYENAYGKIE